MKNKRTSVSKSLATRARKQYNKDVNEVAKTLNRHYRQAIEQAINDRIVSHKLLIGKYRQKRDGLTITELHFLTVASTRLDEEYQVLNDIDMVRG